MVTISELPKFICTACDYKTSRKDLFNKHLLTRIHYVTTKLVVGGETNDLSSEKKVKKGEIDGLSCQQNVGDCKQSDTKQIVCQHCGKTYESRMGLWRHKKVCKKEDIREQSKQKEEKADIVTKQQLLEIIQKKDNDIKDMKEIIMEVLKNHTQLSGDVYNNTTNNNNTINNNTINNMSFNLNFFLNETCKNAVNLSEFIKSIQVSLADIERVGDVGYVNGISEIIISKLQELGVERRPIHCTDAKRETIYVKEANKWEKEGRATYFLQYLIDEVQRANLRQLPLWREKHPNCLTSTSQYTDTYNNMSQELMGGDCKKVSMRVKDDRIMRKIAHYAVIDKSLFLSPTPLLK
jgi:hypothetical protein